MISIWVVEVSAEAAGYAIEFVWGCLPIYPNTNYWLLESPKFIAFWKLLEAGTDDGCATFCCVSGVQAERQTLPVALWFGLRALQLIATR
jgi:hypothetical protein